MKAYIKYNVDRLYEAYLDGNEEIALASKRNIEEATSLYESKGYTNSLAIELGLRLDKANDVLVDTLEAKQEQEVELYKIIVANSYDNYIAKVIHDNIILESLIASYEKRPSEELAVAIKDVAYLSESNLIGVKYFLEKKSASEDNIFSEDVKILKDYYSTFEDLVTKINGL
jgi:hypothetical protein